MCLIVMVAGKPVQHRFSSGKEMAEWCFMYRPDLMVGVKND